MLKRIGAPVDIPSVAIADAGFPAPFKTGLQYSVPARGGWTIVHVGMLVPEAHEIFVCAAGCLRGVVLSAAEMNLADRFSTVAIEEHNVIDGDMEELFTEGVTDILNRLPALPKAVLLYSSCIHHFMGCDLDMCFDELRSRFPTVDFTDCYMTPTMRNGRLNPDKMMRSRLYSLLREKPADDSVVHLMGNCFSLPDSSDIIRLINKSGRRTVQITDCNTYEQYQELASAGLLITTQAVANQGAEELSERFHRTHIFLPISYDADEIRGRMSKLSEHLGCDYGGDHLAEAKATDALERASEIIGDTPVAIDGTFTERPLSLASLLLDHGFNVKTLFVDSFAESDRRNFERLKTKRPDIQVYPTVDSAMRRFDRNNCGEYFALGQKAAYFTGTSHFVNLIEDAGLYGFDGILRLAGMLEEAALNEKDTESVISVKGLGCESCI
ncbi:MAG: nitrogenase component 1 [Clostridia bacterium]|nr:nitrogenase component 1 [Clostridia bacterium]